MKRMIVFLILLLTSACTVEQEPNSNIEQISELNEEVINDSTETETQIIEVIEVKDVNELADVYFNNELDGNKKYFGKKVKLSGYFDRIDKSWLGDLWVYFDGKDSHYGVFCSDMSETEKAKVSEFDKGEEVVFQGLVDTLVSNSREIGRAHV